MNDATAIMHKVVIYVINPIMLVLFAAGFFFFMFGAVQFLFTLSKGGKDDDHKGRNHMLYGILGMFIMVSVAGIINFIASSLHIDISGNPDTSSLNTGTTQSFR